MKVKKSLILGLIASAVFVSAALAEDNIYSAAWALQCLLKSYQKEVAIYDIETALKEHAAELSPEDRIVAAGREFGVYLNRFTLAYKAKDITALNEPFIVRFNNSYCVIKVEKNKVEISSNKYSDNISKEEFLSLWKGGLISVPIVNVLLKRYTPLNSKGRIVCVYSYHNEEFYLFRKIFDKIYQEAKDEQNNFIYVDELGLIPEESVDKLIQQDKLTEKEAFLNAKSSLLTELKFIEKGIGISDPTEFYDKIYSYLAKFKLDVEMENLQYENWKAIVAFDELNLNQLAVTLFCRGNVDRYLETIEQYNQGFWRYNVTIRDRFFKNQIEEITRQNPRACIFILRGLGHFGMEEDLKIPGFTTETMIIGKGEFRDLLVPDQFVQILKRNGVALDKDTERILYLRAFVAECLRSYFQKRLNFEISSATVKANRTISMLGEDKIYRLSLDINHGIAEGRLRSTDSIYDYVFYWLRGKKLVRDESIGAHSSM